jgi:hypothetical protein
LNRLTPSLGKIGSMNKPREIFMNEMMTQSFYYGQLIGRTIYYVAVIGGSFVVSGNLPSCM